MMAWLGVEACVHVVAPVAVMLALSCLLSLVAMWLSQVHRLQ